MIFAFSRSFSLIFVCFLFLYFSIIGCSSSQEPQYSQLPFISVNKRIDLNTISGDILMLINGHLYTSGGYSGLVIIHHGDKQFATYDRACPYDYKEKTAVVTFLPSELKFVCSLCKTEYNTSGQVIKLPGRLPLQSYPTYYDATTKKLSIAN